eukprot:3627139-Pyramimonas_sp.AAC.1
MEKNRLHIKQMRHSGMDYDTYFIRPINGRSSPDTKCPESSYVRITDLSTLGAPRYFIHGTQRESVPSILSIGLSCRADDTSQKKGRQFVRGCPHFPGDNRIQSGLRMDSEVLILISLKNLIRDKIQVWRSANDIVMTAGREGRIPPTHIVQLVGILPNHT